MKREDNQQMQDNILEAAISCKVEAEGAEVSLNLIAHRAGISERTLTRYFPDKEMMIYTAAVRYLKRLYDDFAERFLAEDTSKMTGLQRLQYLVDMQIETYRRNTVQAQVFVRAYSTIMYTAIYRNLTPAMHDEATRNLVIKCVEQGKIDGSIRKTANSVDTYLVLSSCFVGLVQRLVYIYSVDMPKEQHRETILTVLNKFTYMLVDCLSAEENRALRRCEDETMKE